eukprot:2285289-Pleurochrysis_carterae.AAC.1
MHFSARFSPFARRTVPRTAVDLATSQLGGLALLDTSSIFIAVLIHDRVLWIRLIFLSNLGIAACFDGIAFGNAAQPPCVFLVKRATP